MTLYDDKIRDLLENADRYHNAYYEAEVFRGPSLYFHIRSLETRNSPNALSHLEYIYATLASWGMHRMGKRGSNMQSFAVFYTSIESINDKISTAQQFDLQRMTVEQWTLLEEIFKGIKIMASRTSLVGNSKVMHHMMPDIVPPIDRKYTLQYLRGTTSIKNDLSSEWQTMREIIKDFFAPIAHDREFAVKARNWISRQDDYPWDTSVIKVIDNLVIGSRKSMAEQVV